MTCRYGTDGDAVIQVTYGVWTGTFPIGCRTLDHRTDVTVGSGFDPSGALSGDHFGGTIDDSDHALSTTWTTTHVADANVVKAAALELARHLAPLARGCGSPTATITGGGASSGTNTPAAVALLGGGLLVTVGGVLVGIRGDRKPPKVAEPPPADGRVVSGTDAIKVLLQSGLVQPVTRPDGTSGYAPVGDLVQFDHNPQWHVPLTGQSIVNGEQFHDLGVLAYNERPDGTFDTATIVVGVQPAAPPPGTPAPTAAVSPPTDPDATRLGRRARRGVPARGSRAGLANSRRPVASRAAAAHLVGASADAAVCAGRQHRRVELRMRGARPGMDEQQQNLTAAKHWGWLETGTEITGWIADRAIDVLANMGGPGAKGVKDVYTVTSKIGKGIGEAFATGDATNVATGAAQGRVRPRVGQGRRQVAGPRQGSRLPS